MTTPRNSTPLSLRWLKTSVLLGVLIFLSLGVASAKDDKAGTVTDLETLGKQLKAAVKSGDLSEADAIAKYKAAATKGKSNKPTFKDKLGKLVKEGKLTKEEARDLYESAAQSILKSKTGDYKKPQRIYRHKVTLAQARELSKILPTTSTAGDEEGPVAAGFFGWAANATQRFMDNSHKGEPRTVHGISFRLDYQDHDTIGRTWEKVTIKIAHGDWSSVKYNASKAYTLTDKMVLAFDKKWSFPTLKGFPALKPAAWGGPQSALNFRFDQPFEYNGKDAIFVEFVFTGGKAVDGREWKGDLPFGFEYFLDSMPESGGWRVAEKPRGIYRAPRVEAVTSYTAAGQSVWTSSPKGMPYIKWDFKK